jgi:hypothetical protein
MDGAFGRRLSVWLIGSCSLFDKLRANRFYFILDPRLRGDERKMTPLPYPSPTRGEGIVGRLTLSVQSKKDVIEFEVVALKPQQFPLAACLMGAVSCDAAPFFVVPSFQPRLSRQAEFREIRNPSFHLSQKIMILTNVPRGHSKFDF